MLGVKGLEGRGDLEARSSCQYSAIGFLLLMIKILSITLRTLNYGELWYIPVMQDLHHQPYYPILLVTASRRHAFVGSFQCVPEESCPVRRYASSLRCDLAAVAIHAS